MNMLHGKSNSGEGGGEDIERLDTKKMFCNQTGGFQGGSELHPDTWSVHRKSRSRWHREQNQEKVDIFRGKGISLDCQDTSFHTGCSL